MKYRIGDIIYDPWMEEIMIISGIVELSYASLYNSYSVEKCISDDPARINMYYANKYCIKIGEL